MTDKQQNIYSCISSDILNLKFPPNQILKERDLAIKYTTSRTTIRQTLQKLANENKISINPRSKTIVTKINLKKIKESFLLRECLEQTVALLILKKINTKNLSYLSNNIEKQKKLLINYNKSKNKKYIILDNEFHKYLFEIAGLKAFWKIISDYNFDFDRLRLLAAKDTKRAEQSTKEHQIIYMTFKEKKIRNIKKAIKKHFDSSRKYYKNLTKLNPDLIE